MPSLSNQLFRLWSICCACFAPLILMSALGFSLGMGTPDTDHQMLIVLGAALPFTAMCFASQMLLHSYLYLHTLKLLPLLVTLPLSYGLAWFGTTLLASNPHERGLPMLNDHTAAPVTWYLAFVGGWLICSGVGGLVYLAFISLSAPRKHLQTGSR